MLKVQGKNYILSQGKIWGCNSQGQRKKCPFYEKVREFHIEKAVSTRKVLRCNFTFTVELLHGFFMFSKEISLKIGALYL